MIDVCHHARHTTKFKPILHQAWSASTAPPTACSNPHEDPMLGGSGCRRDILSHSLHGSEITQIPNIVDDEDISILDVVVDEAQGMHGGLQLQQINSYTFHTNFLLILTR